MCASGDDLQKSRKNYTILSELLLFKSSQSTCGLPASCIGPVVIALSVKKKGLEKGEPLTHGTQSDALMLIFKFFLIFVVLSAFNSSIWMSCAQLRLIFIVLELSTFTFIMLPRASGCSRRVSVGRVTRSNDLKSPL